MDDLDVLADLMDHLGAPGSEAVLDMSTWNKCAAGYAARQPYFNNRGLHWEGGNIMFGTRHGFDALQGFFDLSEADTEYLFADFSERTGVDTPITFKEVAHRIRQVQRNEI